MVGRPDAETISAMRWPAGWRNTRFSAEYRRSDLNRAAMKIAVAHTIAYVSFDDGVILPHRACPRMKFSERTGRENLRNQSGDLRSCI